MQIIGADTFDTLGESRARQFVGRCARFMQAQGLLPDMADDDASLAIADRLDPLRRLGLVSERAITFAIAVELRCGRMLPSDPRLVEGLAPLREDETMRLDWLRAYLAASPEWSV